MEARPSRMEAGTSRMEAGTSLIEAGCGEEAFTGSLSGRGRIM